MISASRVQHLSSGSLALLVHGVLLFGLMVGVSWKNPPHLPIEADLWTDLPEMPQPVTPPVFAPRPEPLPEAVATPPAPPDIGLEKLARKRLEAQQLAEKRAEELRRTEQDRIEKERVEKEKQEHSRRLIEQELARQMREELDTESSQLRAMQDRAKSGKQARVVRDFQERIRAKIRDALTLPQNLKGDAEVVFQVSLLPNGEVLRVTLVRTSGQALYDGAVERAIYKASPLPLPTEREVAAQFREGLTLKFRPSEDAAGLR